MPRRLLPILLVLLATPAVAEGASDGELGDLNPDEMSLSHSLDQALRGKTSMTTCASGYLMTKSGQHDMARQVFSRCAEAGYTGAMTWMSYLEENGFGGPANPDAAADYDRRAAEAGDPVGMFNHGLDLLRGHGAVQDPAAGRALIDRAAGMGFADARRLQAADYDPEEVTPDADRWKYGPMF